MDGPRIPMSRLVVLARVPGSAGRLARSELVARAAPLMAAAVAGIEKSGRSGSQARLGAAVGLLAAVDAYEPSRDGRFASFLQPYLRVAVDAASFDMPALVEVGTEALELPDRDGSAEEVAVRREADEAVRVFVDALTEPNRSIVLAVFFRGRSRRQVAAALGISPAAVTQRLATVYSRGREALGDLRPRAA